MGRESDSRTLYRRLLRSCNEVPYKTVRETLANNIKQSFYANAKVRSPHGLDVLVKKAHKDLATFQRLMSWGPEVRRELFKPVLRESTREVEGRAHAKEELFKPRPPLEHLAPPEQHKSRGYTGVAAFVDRFDASESQAAPGEYFEVMTLSEIREKKKKLWQERCSAEMNEKLKEWDPQKNPKSVTDAYKTLFVARLKYEITEQMLCREFEQVGPVKSVQLVYDSNGKPRGYAFVEMERERDIRPAYDTLNGRRIMDRCILVDVERGRTVTNWRPRRFGNTAGTPRVPLPPKSSRSVVPHRGGGSNGFRPGGRDRRDDHRYPGPPGPYRGDRDRPNAFRGTDRPSSRYGSDRR